jgi:hypothetical protein
MSATTVDEAGRPEFDVGGWQPTPRRIVVHAFGLHRVFTGAGVWSAPPGGRIVEREWVSGACMAVQGETVAGHGGAHAGGPRDRVLLRIVECLATRRWQRARGFLAYERGPVFGRAQI